MAKTTKKLIKRWAMENQHEICYAWEKALKREPLPRIKGLR